jgi:flagellar hook-associated protein 1 FlgK
MSLTSAFNNAFTGLKANARTANVVSTNISNATNESYGRREASLVSRPIGGASYIGVIRHSDPVIFADRLVSDARLANSEEMFTYAQRMETLVGESGTSGSLTGRLTAFENALLSAASNPASTQRLELVASTAEDFTFALNELSTEVQIARNDADVEIARQVDKLNTNIAALADINDKVVSAIASGGDTSTLEDERQRLLEEISPIVPLRVVPRENGEIAIFTRKGAVLLDGAAYEVGFTPANSVDHTTTLGNGLLSGLTLNGLNINSTGSGLFAGGSLAAQFEIRDEAAVARQAELDGIARDLIERFGPGGPDTTLAATDPGLFTDNGLAFNAANEAGLAGRIALNTLVAPAGGDSWRLRDGLGAAAPGVVGDSTIIQGLYDALNTSTVPSSASLSTVSRSFVAHIAEFSSAVVGTRVRAENEQLFQSSANTAIKELQFAQGVDTDYELQVLMKVEQLYTANAKVVSTVDELFERLLSI